MSGVDLSNEVLHAVETQILVLCPSHILMPRFVTNKNSNGNTDLIYTILSQYVF